MDEMQKTLQLIVGIVNVISFPIVIFSVILVLRQTRELSKQTQLTASATRASVYHSISSQMVEIDKFFIENPQLKQYF